MTEKSVEDLVMTPQEAVKVLKELVAVRKVAVSDIETALASARRKRMEKKDSKSKSSAAEEDVRAAAKRSKGRQKVRAAAVNVEGKSISIPSYEKSEAAAKFLRDALTSDSNFLFNSLSKDELSLLISAMAPHQVTADTVIIKQGDIGDYFYVVEEGRVEFVVDGNSSETVVLEPALENWPCSMTRRVPPLVSLRATVTCGRSISTPSATCWPNNRPTRTNRFTKSWLRSHSSVNSSRKPSAKSLMHSPPSTLRRDK